MVGQRGFSMVETMAAVLVLGILVTAILPGDDQALRFVGASFAETKADRLAAARIETVRAAGGPLGAGEQAFPLPAEHTRGLPAARGHQRARELRPGLFELTVAVSWQPPGAAKRRQVELTTWLLGGGR